MQFGDVVVRQVEVDEIVASIQTMYRGEVVAGGQERFKSVHSVA